MNHVELVSKICDLDSEGQLEDIIHCLTFHDSCATCHLFNLSSLPDISPLECNVIGRCIGVTLHPNIVRYLNHKLGWLTT